MQCSNPRLAKHLVILTLVMTGSFASSTVFIAYAQEGTEEMAVLATTGQLVALLGVLLGTGMRTALPYLKKKSAATPDKPISFDSKFGATFGFSAILAIITAFSGFGGLDLSGAETMLGGFIVSVVYGWGLNSIVNKFAGN